MPSLIGDNSICDLMDYFGMIRPDDFEEFFKFWDSLEREEQKYYRTVNLISEEGNK